MVHTSLMWQIQIDWKLKNKIIIPIFIGKNSKTVKGKTTSEVTRNISFLESIFGRESTNVATILRATDSGDNKYVCETQNINLSALIIVIKPEITIVINK